MLSNFDDIEILFIYLNIYLFEDSMLLQNLNKMELKAELFKAEYFDRKRLLKEDNQNLGMRCKIGNVGMSSYIFLIYLNIFLTYVLMKLPGITYY